MRWHIPLLVAVALLVAASCDQQPAEPPTADNGTPTFTYLNGPENPGESDVYRWSGQFIFWTGHDALNLDAEYVPAEDLGDYIGAYDCGGSQDFPRWDMQSSGQPDMEHEHLMGLRRDTPVYVYELDAISEAWNSGDNTTFCDFMASEWLYKGEIHMVYTDNNWWGNPDYANPFGFRANGFVVDPDGNPYNYREHVKLLCNQVTCDVTHDELDIH